MRPPPDPLHGGRWPTLPVGAARVNTGQAVDALCRPGRHYAGGRALNRRCLDAKGATHKPSKSILKGAMR
jgi:hypothetical protein